MDSSIDSQRVDALFAEIIAVEGAERERLLSQLRGTESSEVMAELESLLNADQQLDGEPEFLADSPIGQLLRRVRLSDDTITRGYRIDQESVELGIFVAAVMFQHNVITLGEFFSILDEWLTCDGSESFANFARERCSDRLCQVDEALARSMELLSAHQLNVFAAFKSLPCRSDIVEALDQIESASLRVGMALFLQHASFLPSDKSAATSSDVHLHDHRFVNLRFLAEGGLGRVSVALDSQLQRQVAIKEIRTELRGDPDSQHRLRREAEITGRLEHPGVVPIYASGVCEDGSAYYAMRLVDGKSLKQAVGELFQQVRDGCSQVEFEQQLRRLIIRFVDVCQTMAYVHQRGFLHRDLKPSNIMLGNHGETLVVDWGLATALKGADVSLMPGNNVDDLQEQRRDGTSRKGAILGTPAFTSPEQLEGEGSIDQRSDIYSLGATLYVILTGQRPVDSLSDTFFVSRHRSIKRPTVRNSWAPPALEAICLKAMRWEPDDRYSTCSELAEDVQRWLAFEPVRAWKEPVSLRLRRWGQRHFGILSVSGVASFLVAVVFIVFSLLLGNNYRELQATYKDLDEKTHQLNTNNDKLTRVEDSMANIADEFMGRSQNGKIVQRRVLQNLASHSDPDQFRDWAIRTLSRPELVIKKRLDLFNAMNRPGMSLNRRDIRVAFSSDQQRYAVSDSNGNISVYDAQTNQEKRRLKGVGSRVFDLFSFSPDGRYLAARFERSSPVCIWDLDEDTPLPKFQTANTVWRSSFDFSPVADEFAYAEKGRVYICSLTSSDPIWSAELDFVPTSLYFSPDGTRLLAIEENRRFAHVIARTSQSASVTRCENESSILDHAWHPSGLFFAAVTEGGNLVIWDAQTMKATRRVEIGIAQLRVSFNRIGDRIVTAQTDGVASLWDFASGECLARSTGTGRHGRAISSDPMKFSADGRMLSHGNFEGVMTTWELAPGVMTRFAGSRGGLEGKGIHVHHPTGLVITCFDDAIRFFNPTTRLECCRLPIRQLRSIKLTPNHDALLLATADGLFQVALAWTDREGDLELHVGAPERRVESTDIHEIEVGQGGDIYWLVRAENGASVNTIESDGTPRRVLEVRDANFFCVNSVRECIATACSAGKEVTIWSPQGDVLHRISVSSPVDLQFSPDGESLAILDASHVRVYSCEGWQQYQAFNREASADQGQGWVSFSADSSLLAAQLSRFAIGLMDLEQGRIIAQLDSSDDEETLDCCFDESCSNVFVLLKRSEQVAMWDLRSLQTSLNQAGIEFDRSLEREVATRSSSLSSVRVTWSGSTPEANAAQAMNEMISRGEFRQAVTLLQQAAWSDASDVDTWCQLMIAQLRDGQLPAYGETRTATLARFAGMASPDETIKLLTVSELVPHQVEDSWPLMRLYTNVRMIPFVSVHRDRREVALILRYLRINNFAAARRNCSLFFERLEALGEESKKIDPAVPLLIEIASHRAKLGLDESIDLSEDIVQLQRKVEQIPSEVHWTDRLMAEILLQDLEQEYQRVGQAVATEQQ